MEDNRSVASSVVSEFKSASRYKNNTMNSSLNNLLPDDESSVAGVSEMTGFCMQTESAHSDQMNGYKSLAVCDGACNRGQRQPIDGQLMPNKLRVFNNENKSKESTARQVQVPELIITPSTPERISDEPDTYEISL